MSIAKIQSGDTVKVIAGNFKGTVGVVTKVIHKQYPKGKNKTVVKTRAAVDAIKKITKYRKSTVYQGQKYAGTMSQVDRFVDVSNLMILDENQKPTRVKIIEKNGKKSRTFQTTGTTIVKKILPKVSKNQEENPLEANNLALTSQPEKTEAEPKPKKTKDKTEKASKAKEEKVEKPNKKSDKVTTK